MTGKIIYCLIWGICLLCSGLVAAGESNEIFLISNVNEPDASAVAITKTGEETSLPLLNASFVSIFSEYVDPAGQVDYPRLRRQRLELYHAIQKIADVSQEIYDKCDKNEKLAFWINTYNLCTLKAVIDNYPIKRNRWISVFYPLGVKHIPNLWTQHYFWVLGRQYNLREIEQEIIINEFNDVRACFAITYCTKSSPPLRNEPYVGRVLENQLNDQVVRFIRNGQAININQSSKVIAFSPVFKLYSSFFVRKFSGIRMYRTLSDEERCFLIFLKDYLGEEDVRFLKTQKVTVSYPAYDWSLNGPVNNE